MRRYQSKYVVCPFYHNEDNLTLYCEGIVEKSTLLFAFRELKDKKEYKERCCCSLDGYKQCPLADVLYKKHEEKMKKIM